jgi:hypothetical protein
VELAQADGGGRLGNNAGMGQRAPMHWTRAGGGASVGHRPGRRLVWHEDRRQGGGQWRVRDGGGRPAAPRQAVPPRAQVGTGRTRWTVAASKGGGGPEVSGRVEGGGSAQRAAA